MPDHVSGKSIVITGAGSGFGRLVAGKAAARGAKVTLGDINATALDAAVAEIRAQVEAWDHAPTFFEIATALAPFAFRSLAKAVPTSP